MPFLIAATMGGKISMVIIGIGILVMALGIADGGQAAAFGLFITILGVACLAILA